MTAGRHPQIAFIQILRGLAALLVVWSHLSGFWLLTNQHTWVAQNVFQAWVVEPFHLFQNGGHLGVIVFFLISGFIITHTSLRETRSAFAIKRTFRILPALWVALLVTWILLAVAAAVGIPLIGAQGGSPVRWLAAGFLGDGFVSGARILAPTWTLVVEIGFYVLTFLVIAASKTRPLQATWIMVAVWVLGCVVALNLPPAFFGDNPALTILISWLIIGRVIYLLDRKLIAPLDAALLFTTVGGLFVLFEETMAPGQLLRPGGWAGVEPIVSYVIALVVFVALLRAPITRVPRVFDFLGDISYSLYLLHIPIGITVINLLNMLGLDYTVCFLAAVAASMGFAWLSYRFVEIPSQRAARWVLRRRSSPRADEPQPTEPIVEGETRLTESSGSSRVTQP